MTRAKRGKSEIDATSTPKEEDLFEEGGVLTEAEAKNLLEDLERERGLRIRALADFDNYRKRVERERGAAAQAGKRPMLLALLDVMDDFDRAIEHANGKAGASTDAIVEGVRAIRKRLAALLQAQGVTPMESAGRPFDPAMHEAVGAVESGGAAPGTVIDEVGRGYLWNGELLRPARVRVAK
jgi:molecular chaperone GrpE